MSYSQTLRLKTFFSLPKVFKERLCDIKSQFLKRGYPEQIIDCKMNKINFCENKKESEKIKKKGVPFVATYHSKLKGLNKIIVHNLYLFCMMKLKKILHQVL